MEQNPDKIQKTEVPNCLQNGHAKEFDRPSLKKTLSAPV